MAIRQTRIFVNQEEPLDWAETMIGRVIKLLTIEFKDSLHSFWFSRYISQLGRDGEDRGDCDFDLIPENFKQAFPGSDQPGHRSVRFRFEILDDKKGDFEVRLQELVIQHGYAISDVREYDQLADLGGNRFLGGENRLPVEQSQRAQLVTYFLHSISALVLHTLVGPDPENRYHFEHNDELLQNPNGSIFESIHHLFCNITNVPLRILISQHGIGTDWAPPTITDNAKLIVIPVKF